MKPEEVKSELTWGDLKRIALERNVPDNFIVEVILGYRAPEKFKEILVVPDNKVFVLYKPDYLA